MSALFSVPPSVAVVASTSGSDFGHGDRLRLLTSLQGKVNANLLADLQLNILARQRLETFGLGADDVFTGEQSGSVILTGAVRHQGLRHTSIHIYHGYRRAGQHAATLICNGSENPTKIRLRKHRRAEEKYPKNNASSRIAFWK